MNNRPWFSVIIPFYNSEKYLEEAVCSVVGQTASAHPAGIVEIILVDDASTDGSHELAKRLAAAHDEGLIRLITLSENKGAGEARNEGIRNAKGRYLMFLDSDDAYEPGLFDCLLQNLEKDKPDVVVWGVVQEDYLPRGRVKISMNIPRKKICRNADELRGQIMELEEQGLYGYLWNKAYKAKTFKSHGIIIPTQSFNEDEMANIAFFGGAESAIFVPRALTRYRRRREGSLTHRYLADYYEIAMKRVSGVLRQQKAWDLYDDKCRRELASILLRYDLSALMRLADKRCRLSHYDKRKLVRHMRAGSLGKELLPAAHPESKVLRMLARWLRYGRVESCLLLGRAVWFARTRLPGIYGRLAGV